MTHIINSHYQAITTKYLGPTNHYGERIKATCYSGSITVGYDYALNDNENHDAAAAALVAKMGWSGDYIGGGSPCGRGNVYVRKV